LNVLIVGNPLQLYFRRKRFEVMMIKHKEEMFIEEVEGLVAFPSEKNKDIFISRWKDRVIFDDDD